MMKEPLLPKPPSIEPPAVERLHIAISDKLVFTAEGKLAISLGAFVVIVLAILVLWVQLPSS